MDKKISIVIAVLSVVVPALVAVLLFIPQTGKLGDFDVSMLPHLNGSLNTFTSIALLLGLYYIKNGNIVNHRRSMMSAFVISTLFLVSYVLYHYQAPPTSFGGEGLIKTVYYVLLISHIILAAIVVPFVLYSFYFALTNKIDKHKKIVKWTYPIWLYVAVTGVLVYLMIRPYYGV